MSLVRAKKQLGQHFLTDKNIAEKIVNSLQLSESVKHVLEVGPGMGILSDFLFQQKGFETYLIDIDRVHIILRSLEHNLVRLIDFAQMFKHTNQPRCCRVRHA